MPRQARRPARTDEGRERQLVSLALDLAERQLSDGTASSQVITHFLKAGSMRERLEQDRLRRENELLQAKVESMASGQRVEELYAGAIRAMSVYSGNSQEEEPEYDDYEEYYN